MKRHISAILFATAAVLAAVAPASAAPAPHFVATTSYPGTLPTTTQFQHAYTVTNDGDAPGAFGVWETFGTAVTVITIQSPDCAIYYGSLKGGGKVQAGVYCKGPILNPGQSITYSSTLKTKFGSACANISVNNRSVQSGRWCVTVV